MSDYRFKMGMFLNELGMSFDQSLAVAKDIGAEYVWFDRIPGEGPIDEMSDVEVCRIKEKLDNYGLKIALVSTAPPFKQMHLTDLKLDTLQDNPAFQKELQRLVRGMEIAVQLGVDAVLTYSFAWPGEYSAGKPTWPMRWATRGGIISDDELEKLVKAFSIMADKVERFGVNLVVSMMPWNYTNTTGNFRRIMERVGSKHIKCMWGPADNLNCGESDTATTGFLNIRPWLHCLHIKDLHIIDGAHLKFEYRPVGTGDVDYLTVLRNLRESCCDAFLCVATHFRPESGSAEEAMRINYTNLRELIHRVESETSAG